MILNFSAACILVFNCYMIDVSKGLIISPLSTVLSIPLGKVLHREVLNPNTQSARELNFGLAVLK